MNPLLFPYHAVVFDLDGTLIDSAPSILSSFENVLKKAKIQPLLPLNETIIGPPLRQTLVNLTGITNDLVLERLVDLFVVSYDAEGYKATRVYDGIEQLLDSLMAKGVPLAIATNKRRVPTLKILEHLGWLRYFSAVATIDSISPPYPCKSELIRSLLDDLSVLAVKSVFLGDKLEDGEAASANKMPFIGVTWGYGDWETISMESGWRLASSASEAMVMLRDE